MNVRRVSRYMLTFGFTLLLSVMFALPVLAMGKGCMGGTGGAAGTTLHVPCIEWAETAAGRHIHVQAFVVDENGAPVLDAVVSMSARQDGVEYGVVGGPTEAYGGLDGGVNCPGGPPPESITRDFCVNSAPAGFYDAVVLSVTKDGYSWDGSTPANGVDFVGKAK